MTEDSEVQGWVEIIRDNWESFARSKYRNFFVASHRGWNDLDAWKAHAAFDAAIVLHELDPVQLLQSDVLEVGCGVGRLAAVLAPRVKSYTGIDIAPGMVEEARYRYANLHNVRFLIGNGLTVPAVAADRHYSLAFAHAVFIHCPRDVIRSLIASVCDVLTPGGEFRFQLRADSSDPTGIRPSKEAPIDVELPQLGAGDLSAAELHALCEIEAATKGRYYMGHAFRYDEVEPFISAAASGMRSRVFRFHPEDIYVDLVRT